MSDWSGLPTTPGSSADLASLRRQYAQQPLVEAEMAADPVVQFRRWFDEVALLTDVVPEPNAMVFGTADAHGRPSARTVLLKGLDERGFVLFTNLGSRKAVEAAANPYGSLVFPWIVVERQVVVIGRVEPVSRDESAAYFRSRPRGSQIGAWTSRQSTVIAEREALERRRVELETRFAGGEVPVPGFWGGLRVVPDTVEFWHGRPDRLHDRLRYRRQDDAWALERLSP